MAWGYGGYGGGYGGFAPYVSVAERRARAAREVAKLAKKGRTITPVALDGKTIVHTFWGKAWCELLESYADFESRMPRGRSYVRNGSVVDLQIEAGRITALVSGSELYDVEVTIARLPAARWRKVVDACAGQIGSVVALLEGRLPDAVLQVLARVGTGLFPPPAEIEFTCSCPDAAYMCKHIAAALYGVGARLDTRPELFFLLRQVDQQELVTRAIGRASPVKVPRGRTIDRGKIASIFGIDMAGAPEKKRRAPMKKAKKSKKKGSR